jgi:hypothetical protein
MITPAHAMHDIVLFDVLSGTFSQYLIFFKHGHKRR